LKAVVVGEFGGPEQLRVERVADPVPGHGQIRVAVHAAGVNPLDAGNRADGSWAGLRVPCILGYDIAGVVDVTGPGVTEFRPGDRVMATPELDLDPLLDANITFHGILIQDDGQRTREIAALLASGTLRPVISHQLPLAEAARAHRILEGQHPGGKVVLTLPR
jgi:NADPH:quinone reductase-like Zn-dependent oxidoreductase